MRKLFTLYFLVALMAGCKRNVGPTEPDVATIVAGKYKLTKARWNGLDVTEYYKADSLLITRVTASSVKADFSPRGATAWSETWTLSKVTNDTIKVTSDKFQFVKQYENGTIAWSNPVGVIHFWYEQIR